MDGGTAEVYVGPGGSINQATDPGGGAAHIPQTTSYPVTVNITDPKFISLTNVTVTMNLQQAALGEISVDLIAPTGPGERCSVTRRPQPAKLPRIPPTASRGRTWESPLAVNSWGRFSIFCAARSITDRGATLPFVGTFRPEGNLALLNGLTAAQLNGTWTLRITDFRDSASRPPATPDHLIQLDAQPHLGTHG